MDRKPMTSKEASRRDFVRKAAYVAPLILTLKAAPAFAKRGSGRPGPPGPPGPPFGPPGPPFGPPGPPFGPPPGRP